MRKYLAAIGIILLLGVARVGWTAEKSVTGTLEDSFCYLTMGAHGPNHKKCATDCARRGIPVSLVEQRTGDVYILLPPQNESPIPGSISSRMEDQVTVTGDEYIKGGIHYLTVKSVK